MIDILTLSLAKKYVDQTVIDRVAPEVDNISIVNSNGILALAGLASAETGSVPVKQGDGSLKWLVTDASAVNTLLSRLGELPEEQTLMEYINNNVAQAIIVGEEKIEASSGVIEIPLATATKYGVVKSSQGENQIEVSEDGTMTVSSLNVNKLTQSEEEELILSCGDAN